MNKENKFWKKHHTAIEMMVFGVLIMLFGIANLQDAAMQVIISLWLGCAGAVLFILPLLDIGRMIIEGKL